jgi:hypothetical protein
MGQYGTGDVLLASVALDDRSPPKIRPVVVIGTNAPGLIRICPVSSRPPFDAPCLPLTIDNFSHGGLDLFGESYIMTSRVLTIRNTDVIGKKGRLTPDSLADIAGRATPPPATAARPGQKKPGQQRR